MFYFDIDQYLRYLPNLSKILRCRKINIISDVELISYNLSAFKNRHRSGHRSGHHKLKLYRHPSNSILVARHQKSTSY